MNETIKKHQENGTCEAYFNIFEIGKNKGLDKFTCEIFTEFMIKRFYNKGLSIAKNYCETWAERFSFKDSAKTISYMDYISKEVYYEIVNTIFQDNSEAIREAEKKVSKNE